MCCSGEDRVLSNFIYVEATRLKKNRKNERQDINKRIRLLRI